MCHMYKLCYRAPSKERLCFNDSSWHFQVKEKILFLGVLEYNKEEKIMYIILYVNVLCSFPTVLCLTVHLYPPCRLVTTGILQSDLTSHSQSQENMRWTITSGSILQTMPCCTQSRYSR